MSEDIQCLQKSIEDTIQILREIPSIALDTCKQCYIRYNEQVQQLQKYIHTNPEIQEYVKKSQEIVESILIQKRQKYTELENDCKNNTCIQLKRTFIIQSQAASQIHKQYIEQKDKVDILQSLLDNKEKKIIELNTIIQSYQNENTLNNRNIGSSSSSSSSIKYNTPFTKLYNRKKILRETNINDITEDKDTNTIINSGFIAGTKKYELDRNIKGLQKPASVSQQNQQSFSKFADIYNNPVTKAVQASLKGDTATTSSSSSVDTKLTKYNGLPLNSEGKLEGKLASCDPALVEVIMNDVLDNSPGVRWDDIAGLEFAKKNVIEIVVWPMLRPDLFKGLRGPPKGMLLFGPPGTGKTLIGKAIATESNAKFFSISASSLTSKWHGQGEKLVRTLFSVATYFEPSIIFIDEIDSLLSQRQDSEFEATRRIKTEFLVQLDGVATTTTTSENNQSEPRVQIIGATNRPYELDEAARRRLVKKLYIPLPNNAARKQLISHLLKKEHHQINESDLDAIVNQTEGYSGADLKALCTDAAMEPLRDTTLDILNINSHDVRPIVLSDFISALSLVRASVNQSDLSTLERWNEQFGSFPIR